MQQPQKRKDGKNRSHSAGARVAFSGERKNINSFSSRLLNANDDLSFEEGELGLVSEGLECTDTSRPPTPRNDFSFLTPLNALNELTELNAIIPHANEAATQPRSKVVFIIGPTGVGKSKLSLDLCLALQSKGVSAEIISADSMQVYRGCDIATAKATSEEREKVVHHLLDVCSPNETFNAADYLRSAKTIINDLTKNGKLPVVVGGTQLYIQLLLWESAVEEEENGEKSENNLFSSSSVDALHDMTDEELMNILKKLDSKRAQQLHLHDRRRIIRSIEITAHFGVPHSELIEKHNRREIRYDACILWLDLRDRLALERRLRARLAEMCANGLLDEVRWLAKELKLKGALTDCNEGPPLNEYLSASSEEEEKEGNLMKSRKEKTGRKGVLQGIGYKELLPLVLSDDNDDENDSEKEGKKPTLDACIDTVVLRSLQYARQQRKWIKNKFLIRRKNVPLYFLETTDEAVAAWEEEILSPALQIVEDFLSGKEFSETHQFAAARCLPDAVKLRADLGSDEDVNNSNECIICERCQKEFRGPLAFQQHLLLPKKCKKRNKKPSLNNDEKTII